MTKRISLLLILLALMPLAAFAQSYSALLSGAAEVPGPADPDGVGLAVITLDGTNLRYSIWTQNIGAPTLAHIHTGAAGVSGAPVVTFDVNALGNGSTPVTADVANQIKANPAGFYVNVHTTEFPNGAVRGQLSVPAADAGSSVQWLPVVGKSKGANNTNFVTDLRILNLSGAAANVTLDYFSSSTNGQSGPNVTKSVTVGANEEKVLDDLIGVTIGVDNQLGALKVTSDRSVLVTARVINDLRTENLGTTGLSIPAQEAGATSGTLTFLSQATDSDFAANKGFRTNIGHFNPSSTPVTVTFTARRSDGTVLGTNSRTIPGFGMVQGSWLDAVPSVTDRSQENFYITWTATAPVFIYASVVDNKTGDSVYIK